MIEKQLSDIVDALQSLIEQTAADIDAIKSAKHSGVAESVERKNALIAKFEAAKTALDAELLRITKGGQLNLGEILNAEDKAKLAEFKQKLPELHAINKDYAKLVLVVKNYFDGLVNAVFAGENGTDNAYNKDKPSFESIFKIKV